MSKKFAPQKKEALSEPEESQSNISEIHDQDNNNNNNNNNNDNDDKQHQIIKQIQQVQSNNCKLKQATTINLPNEMFIVENNNNNNNLNPSSANDQLDSSSASASQASSVAKFSNPPWWHRRTRLERYLCVLVLASVLVSVCLGLLMALVGRAQFGSGFNARNAIDSFRDPATASRRLAKQAPIDFGSKDSNLDQQSKQFSELEQKESKVCMSETCVKTAAELLRNLDPKVDPCQDFYRYSCGGWIDSQNIPEDKTSVSVFSSVQDELDNKLRILIEKKNPSADEPAIVSKMRSLYNSCMNTNLIEELGDEPLLSTIKKLGGWPVLGKKSGWQLENNQHWLDLLIKFRHLGFSHDVLIDLSVSPDFQNNTHHVIDLDQALLGMPDRSYLLKGLNDSAVAAYYKLMVNSALYLGAQKEDAEAQMLDVLNFETQIANSSLAREDRRNISSLYNKMNLAQLSAIAPNINWSKFLTNLLDQPLRDNEDIIVDVPTYFTKLDHLLKEADPKTLTNYLIWRVVMQSISTLGKRWRELAQSYSGAITGQEREGPRWEQCLGSLTGTLGIAMSSMYIKNHFDSNAKGLALEMVDYIRREFGNILDQVDWMDEQTRQEARAKANAITAHIGYPDELLNDTLVEELYAGLDFDKTKYYENILHLRKWSVDYSFNQLRKPNLKVDWRKHARTATVNAFYNSLDNSIEFPAGILQGHFFERERPKYMNFGAIGFVIGHEITHGFDDRGRQFDKDGNNRNWWNSQTDERFKERAQCIIDQYGNYTVPEQNLKVNGINTQGENIADNGGLKEAFNAYNEWVKRNGEEPRLPGIKLNQRQLFWLSAANVWCGKYRPEALKMRVMVGSHPPSQFRVMGPLSNLKEFSETFNCPLGSAMNPVQKCSVW